MQPDLGSGINLPTFEYLQMRRGLVIFDQFSSGVTTLQRPDERRWTTLKNCFAALIYCQKQTARLHFLPLRHTHMKAPLKIMHRLSDQLSFLKVRVFIKIDRLTGRYFEVLPLPWPLQKGGVGLAIWVVFPRSDKHSLQQLLFKPDHICDLN